MNTTFFEKQRFTSNNQGTRIPIPELDNQILVDQTTGQLFLKGPVLKLIFPMLVVRHGQTPGNLRKVLQGQVDGAENQLNEVGKEQAQQTAINLFNELKNRLGHTNLIELAHSGKLHILKSPITRAQDTADFFIWYFKNQTGIIPGSKVEPDLKEISFGKYDGFSLEEIIDQEFTELVIRYRTTQDATINWKGTGESFLDTVIRAKRLLERLNREYQGKMVIAFTHGTFISALRTVLGESALLTEDRMIAFRDNILETGVPHWLGQSQDLIHTVLN